jgi:hypothetical protein
VYAINLFNPATFVCLMSYVVVYQYDACDQISHFFHQLLLRKMRRKMSWTDGRTDGRTDGWTDRRTELKQYTPFPFGKRGYNSTFFVTFFSATIDDRDLIFGHKLYIGTTYDGKPLLTRQIPTSCLSSLLIVIHIEHTFCIQ